MQNKLSTDEFKRRLLEKYPDFFNEYMIMSEYTGNKNEMLFKHKCGKTFSKTPMNMLRHPNCPFCNSRYTSEKFKAFVKNKYGDEYDLIGNFINTKTKIKMRHNLNGSSHEFEILPDSFIQGSICTKCAHHNSGKHTKTQKEFEDEVKNLVDDEYTVLGAYYNNSTPIKMKHNKCGYEYNVKPINFLKGNRCPHCFGSPLKTTEDIKDEIKKYCGDDYQLIGEYVNAKTKIKIKHKCGYVYEILPGNLLYKGNECEKCVYKESSKEENEVVEFIKEIYKGKIERNIHFYNNNRREYKEADIYLPDKNIVIEFDGLYWHSEEKGNKDKNYHLNKMNFFNERNIRVINIFEDEWKLKREIVKSKLKHILNVDNEEKIYARKCEIKEISTSEKNNFLNKYHIQGEDKSCYKIGLFYENELVAVMTFALPRASVGHKKSDNNEFELSRYAAKNVIGGFSKLLKFAIQKYNIKKIYTFADLRWTDKNKNVYEKNGFTLIKTSKPDYWYFKMGIIKREHRAKYQKYKLKKRFPLVYSDNKTEIEIMHEMKYLKIWDCGQLLYEMELKKN